MLRVYYMKFKALSNGTDRLSQETTVVVDSNHKVKNGFESQRMPNIYICWGNIESGKGGIKKSLYNKSIYGDFKCNHLLVIASSSRLLVT